MRSSWKIDKRLELLPLKDLKGLIDRGHLTGKSDWRLNPQQSIEGGALYLNYLESYWQQEENRALLKNTPGIQNSEVILASYNSGAARVKSRIQKNGAYWLESKDLKEAFKYVRNISSYCYSFEGATK